MATSLVMKRMGRERPKLEMENDDYVVSFKDDNLLKFQAYVIGPSDTLYSYKFIKLQFDIPTDYPLAPPKCKFIQHSGGRIHPNLYVEGKVCLSILGTWEGEPWAYAMTSETVLITIRSLLDNHPYTHEPGCEDDEEYNNYVQYSTWRCLLLDYLRHETDPKLKLFLQRYVAKHGDAMMTELARQSVHNIGIRSFENPYGYRAQVAKYDSLTDDLSKAVTECKAAVLIADKESEKLKEQCEAAKKAQVDADEPNALDTVSTE